MQVSLEVFSLTPLTICLPYRARAPLEGWNLLPVPRRWSDHAWALLIASCS